MNIEYSLIYSYVVRKSSAQHRICCDSDQDFVSVSHYKSCYNGWILNLDRFYELYINVQFILDMATHKGNGHHWCNYFEPTMNKILSGTLHSHQSHLNLLHDKRLVYKCLVQYEHLADICRK